MHIGNEWPFRLSLFSDIDESGTKERGSERYKADEGDGWRVIFCRRARKRGEGVVDIVVFGRLKSRDKAAESGFQDGFRLDAASHCKGKAGALMYHCRFDPSFDPMIDGVVITVVNRFAVVIR